jgi:hypothetical protein
MGRYAPHVIHTLSAEKRDGFERQTVSGNCGCSQVSEGLKEIQIRDLRIDSGEGVKEIGSNVKFGVTAERRQRGWDINSPYLVVEANEGVIGEHSDIFNPVFVAFLRSPAPPSSAGPPASWPGPGAGAGRWARSSAPRAFGS